MTSGRKIFFLILLVRKRELVIIRREGKSFKDHVVQGKLQKHGQRNAGLDGMGLALFLEEEPHLARVPRPRLKS